MLSNYRDCLDFTLKFEGGKVNHPADPGGRTNRGITQRTYDAWRKRKGIATQSVYKISTDEVEAIYRTQYWNAVNGDNLARGVDLATFDYGVNSGPATARKQLMKVVGGPDDETVRKLCRRRLSIYQTFRHWKTFGKGWTRRITACEALGVKMALMAAQVPVRPKMDEQANKAAREKAHNSGGAVATGGGTAVSPEAVNPDQIAGWMLGGIVVVGVLITAYLLWRAYVASQRQEAYETEAAS